MIRELNEQNFNEYIKKGIKFIAFLADWCSFCQQQKPVLKELSDNDIFVGTVDSDCNPNLVQQWNIQAFPSFILFKNGEPITTFSGLHTKYDLLNKLLNSLNK